MDSPIRARTVVSTGADASLRSECSTPISIFHEPWWLDVATGGHWGKASVVHGNQLLGEMPYYVAHKGIWRVSRLPPLTRTLGPVIKPMGLEPAHEFRHRLHVTSQIIEQLPRVDSFFQVFDYHVQDALAFALHGFTVSARYTFQVSPLCNTADLWARMHCKTRNVIRSAAETLKVAPIEAPKQFLNFYEANLASQSRENAYGIAVMEALIRAFVEHRAGCLLGAYDRGGRLAGAIGLVWDRETMYFLLSTRAQGSHNGAISLLLWTAIQDAINRHLTFDFDGFSCVSTFNFLNGFGGSLKQRLGVELSGMVYSVARTLKRTVAAKAGESFAPYL
ncbi:GNAT family N-acetyltransferase [Paraburkholderia sp. SIMBA_030]|uniref:GNAT family N-acetyltransferase n=1 Tax=Paraburkholderia sp. SIMBA_030 TaxID=3085773 RepID=UPI00397B3951